MKMSKRVRTMLLCLLAMVMLLPTQVLAAGKIDVEEDVSLTISYAIDEKAVEDVEFDLYYVAEVSPYAEFALTGDFADYQVTIEDDWDSKGWDNLALTLAGMAQADQLVPLASGKTNVDGKLVFSSQAYDMKPGLYLVVGKTYIVDKYVYTPSAFMASLPGMDMDANEWDYNVTVMPKAQAAKRDDLIDRKVLKVWNDNGYSDRRPEEIQVQLLQDGKAYGDPVTLNADNEWRYTWEELKPEHDWSVVEVKVPEKYTVSISRSGITFVITNTTSGGGKNDDDPTPTTPAPTEPVEPTVTPESPEVPKDVITDEFDPFGVLGEYDEKLPFGVLPATGTTWWLVPILACAGILLFVTGLFRNRKYNGNEEK